MRMRSVLIASTSVLVLTGAALVPAWVTTPTTSAVAEDAGRIPNDLFGLLIEKCQGAITLGAQQMVFPDWVDAEGEINDRIWVQLYVLDEKDGTISPVEPTAEQAAEIAEANACFGSYTLDDWTEPPRFDGFHRNMYYEYVAGALVPCLVARGIDAEIPPRQAFKSFDASTWYYQNHLVGLDFDEALSVWRACPPVPEYLLDAAHTGEPAITIFQP